MQLLMKLYSRVGRHDKTALFLSKSHTIRSNLYYVIVSTVLCSRTNIVLLFPHFGILVRHFLHRWASAWHAKTYQTLLSEPNITIQPNVRCRHVLFFSRLPLETSFLSQDLRDCSANNNWLKLGQSAPQASPMNSEVRLSTRTLSSQRSLSILSTCTWDGTWWQSPQLQLSSRFASKDQILVGNWLFLASSEGRAAH